MPRLSYRFQTVPMAHQARCLELSREREFFAYLMEQGTGKTKVAIDTAAYLFECGKIDALVALGPSDGDIPDNWVDQIQIHLPHRIDRTVVRLQAKYMKVTERRKLEFMLKPDGLPLGNLRIITTNIEAIRAGNPIFKMLLDFCRKFRVMLVVDESDMIKTPNAAQTKGALKLSLNAVYRRIATGTFSESPLEAYSQMEFLKPGLLGFDSYTAFKAHHCQMLPPEHGLVRYTAGKMAARIGNAADRIKFQKKMQEIIQLPARDQNGLIIYKNQAELAQKIAAHSFRVLKEDCLDLPPKVYEKRYVELTPKQREIYNSVRDEVITEFEHGGQLTTMTVSLAITRLLRLQQIVCNHYAPDPDPDAPTRTPPRRSEPLKTGQRGKKTTVSTTNPRLLALKQILEEMRPKAKAIIWCRHHPEIRETVEFLTLQYGPESVGQLHGEVTSRERIEMRKKFQDRDNPMRWCVGQVKSGIGIDLFAATVEVYYSNSYSLRERLQSEDRPHRIGQTEKVTIFDIMARDTLDERIVEHLRQKKDIKDVILGDNPKNWI